MQLCAILLDLQTLTKYLFKVMEEKDGMDPRRVMCEEYEDESLSLHAEIGIQTGI